MSTWDYISTGLGIGAVFGVMIAFWALIEWATHVTPANRTIQPLHARPRAVAEANPPQPPPVTDAWELISHADVKLFLSQSTWDEVTTSSKAPLVEGSAPALPDSMSEASRLRST